jgi:nucleotide-binding universal stress UspA family protein
MDLKKILCPVDFSPAPSAALMPAASLAKKYGAEVILLHVIGFPGPGMTATVPEFDLQGFLDEVRERAEQRLEDFSDNQLGDDVPTRCVVENGIPAAEIVGVAEKEAADSIVLPTHSRRGLERLMMGSVAEKVVRLASCPVLTVHPGTGEAADFHPTRVMFATDFSDYADLALPHALSMASEYGAELLMVHVATVFEADPANPEWAFPEVPPEYAQAVVQDAEKELDRRVERAASGKVKVRTRMTRGFDPGSDLLTVAEQENIDLIVMATHGRTGILHALAGSTAERVVRHATCPVLTVRPNAD